MGNPFQGHPRDGQAGSSSPGGPGTISPQKGTPSKASGSWCPNLLIRLCAPNIPQPWGEGWLAGGREAGGVGTVPVGGPCGGSLWDASGLGLSSGCHNYSRHAPFGLRAPLWKMRGLDSPEPLQCQCTRAPKGPPHLLEKTFPGMAGRFALRQHHLLALLGMTPILSSGTPESLTSVVILKRAC